MIAFRLELFMKYKITKQYTKDIESPLAEFNNRYDIDIFIEEKISSDDAKKLKLIYRLYSNKELLCEFNKENIDTLIARAQYAEGNVDLPDSFDSQFNVTKQSLDTEDISIAKFFSIDDAKLFVLAKLNSDASEGKHNESYSIFNGTIFVDKMSQELLTTQQQSEGAEGNQRKIIFRPAPTPFVKRLQPKGLGSSFIKYEDEEDDKNNKDT